MISVLLSEQPQMESKPLDGVICALGYESRSCSAYRRHQWNAATKYAIAYEDQETLAFHDNEQYFYREGFTIVKLGNDSFSQAFKDILLACASDSSPVEIAIDITCFSRFRLASIFEQILFLAETRTINLTLAYTISDYVSPPEVCSTNSRVGPVIPAFAGWSCDPDLPPAAVVGLGYEKRKALGAVEYLQSANVWLFAPSSPVREFYKEVISANSGLIESIPFERILEYKVDRPALTYSILDSLISGMHSQFNPVLMPFGPKIFFVLCLLIAVNYPNASVWSVDGEESEEPVNRLGSDHTIILRVTLQDVTSTEN